MQSSNPSKPQVYYTEGSAIKGERIAASARKIDPPVVCHGMYGSHRGQQTKLKGGAFCVIELPLRSLRHE